MDNYHKRYDKKYKIRLYNKNNTSSMLSYFFNVCLPSLSSNKYLKTLSNRYFITLSI